MVKQLNFPDMVSIFRDLRQRLTPEKSLYLSLCDEWDVRPDKVKAIYKKIYGKDWVGEDDDICIVLSMSLKQLGLPEFASFVSEVTHGS